MIKTLGLSTLLVLLFLSFVAPAAAGDGESSDFRTVQVRDSLFVIQGPEQANTGNVAVYLTEEGVILVDDKFDDHAQAILHEVSILTDLPIRYIFNTHHHLDHSGGNKTMLGIAEVFAHENARRNMKEDTGSFGSNRSADELPRISFIEGMSVHLGGKEVRAHYFGRGHTDGDIVVYFPDERCYSHR